MNYDHLYHAGSITDILKHSMYCALFDALSADHKKMHVIDTHGGAGAYDLARPEVQKTKEAAQGIMKLYQSLKKGLSLGSDLEYYMEMVIAFQEYMSKGGSKKTLNYYPGSPVIAHYTLRDNDRLSVCESHGPVFQQLTHHMAPSSQVALYKENGFEFLRDAARRPGYLFVCIDPPYEGTTEEVECQGAIIDLLKQKGSDTSVILWHPIKNPSRTFELYQAYQRSLKELIPHKSLSCLAIEILWDQSFATSHLAGTGLLIFNAPESFQMRAQGLLQDILKGLQLGSDSKARAFWLQRT